MVAVICQESGRYKQVCENYGLNFSSATHQRLPVQRDGNLAPGSSIQIIQLIVRDEQVIPITTVIVALQPISKGSEIVSGSIGRRDWPVFHVPAATIFFNKAELIGRVAKVDIAPGQVIIGPMLSDDNEPAVLPVPSPTPSTSK
jgi:flagella basal body P-ring formation protein FlgA